jgi:hypothetical protein
LPSAIVVYSREGVDDNGVLLWSAKIIDAENKEVIGVVEPMPEAQAHRRADRLISISMLYDAMPSLLGDFVTDEEKE